MIVMFLFESFIVAFPELGTALFLKIEWKASRMEADTLEPQQIPQRRDISQTRGRSGTTPNSLPQQKLKLLGFMGCTNCNGNPMGTPPMTRLPQELRPH